MTVPVLYQWFARSADRHPDAVAVEVGAEALTYAELRAAAEGLATAVLDAHGAVPARVTLLANHSLVALVGYLAAQRLGAAVVPLNPAHPAHRNELIRAELPCEVLIADGAGAAQCAETPGTTVLRLRDADVRALRPGPLPPPPTDPDAVAYVLFTSGSTGRPKGVPITHRNAAPYVARNLARFGVGPGCRLSHTFDLTFDPSVFDLFVGWGGGATLVVPTRTDLLTPVDHLVDKRITHWFSVPAVVSVAAELGHLPVGRPTVLRQSIFIGEQLTLAQARAWRAVAPAARIDNVYGPTELTVACTEYRLPADEERWPVTSNDTVPIGPVYEFLDHVIVGEDGRPAPAGELCVRGEQRFAGYVNAADNRGRFLARDGDRYVPYDGTTPGPEHYYRTGDQVRREAGELVHLGRLDHQLKLRGYRIELGEIEAAMGRHPAVTRAVVLVVRDGDRTELAGCYTGTPVPAREFDRWLRGHLPIHMVPRRLHHRPSLPLNVNGKIDRGALTDDVLGRTG